MSSHALTPYPAEFAARYRDAGLWRGETLGALLRRLAATHGDAIALDDGQRRLSFAELDHEADRVAAGFTNLGFGRADRVVMQLPNCTEFFTLLFGLARAGIAPVLALPAHRRAELIALCSHVQARAYIGPSLVDGFDYGELAGAVRASCASVEQLIVVGGPGRGSLSFESLLQAPRALPACSASDVALFLLSGGSTGTPKVIPRTHDDYLYSVETSADICRITADDAYLCVLPAAHNFALSSAGALGALCRGAKVVLCRDPSPSAAFARIAETGATIAALTPPLARLWLDAAPSPLLRTLRLLQVGGACFDREAAATVMPRMGARLQQVFGMAEGLVCYTRLDDAPDRIERAEVQAMSAADELRIVNEADVPVADGEMGELCVRGPYTVRGYWAAPALNAQAFTADGFYRTGDLVRRTADGRLVVTGRIKDVVNRGGETFAADDVERHLRAHAAVKDAAVFGQPDARLGERSCAVVVTCEPVTAAALRHFLRARGLAAFKIPDRIEFVSSLPTTGVGKIDKKRLQAELERGAVS